MTSAGVRQQCLFVIYRYLLARLDVTQRKEKHVAVEGAHVSVGIAGVINIVRAVPADVTAAHPTAAAQLIKSEAQVRSPCFVHVGKEAKAT